MQKSKRIVVYFFATCLVFWCVKGFWTSNDLSHTDDFEDLREDAKVKLKAEETYKDELISSLRAQLSQVKKVAKKCEAIDSKLPKIYAITPTYARHVQKAELTRLSHTLMLVPNLHWVIIEDSGQKTSLVNRLLEKSGLEYTHLNAETPKNWKLKGKEPRWIKPRGVLQRNTALQWIRDNVPDQEEAILYFLDDDNTYSLELFEEMRSIKKVGVWPVGLVGGVLVERPKVNADGKVVGWLTVWSPERPFAIDMAGFAVNMNLFLSVPDGKFSFESEKGYQESEFLKHFVTLNDLEVKADNCTKVYVWHTRTEKPGLREEEKLRKAGKKPTNLEIEV